MPRGGRRNPPGGRPVGSVKPVTRKIIKATRFTPEEWALVREALKKYDGKLGKFMRSAVLEKAARLCQSTGDTEEESCHGSASQG